MPSIAIPVYTFWVPSTVGTWSKTTQKGFKTMVRKIVFALLLALQFAAVANLASALPPFPGCFPCP
jgi:hypothetical protein